MKIVVVGSAIWIMVAWSLFAVFGLLLATSTPLLATSTPLLATFWSSVKKVDTKI